MNLYFQNMAFDLTFLIFCALAYAHSAKRWVRTLYITMMVLNVIMMVAITIANFFPQLIP